MDRSGKTVEQAEAPRGLGRRSSPRVHSRIEASYEDMDRHVFLQTVDLAEGGVFLASPSSPPVGTSAMVLLELPGNPTILRLRGSVVRHQTHPVAGFVVRFDSRSEADSAQRALRSFVERSLSSPSSSHH